jgi:hypothetical protein
MTPTNTDNHDSLAIVTWDLENKTITIAAKDTLIDSNSTLLVEAVQNGQVKFAESTSHYDNPFGLTSCTWNILVINQYDVRVSVSQFLIDNHYEMLPYCQDCRQVWYKGNNQNRQVSQPIYLELIGEDDTRNTTYRLTGGSSDFHRRVQALLKEYGYLPSGNSDDCKTLCTGIPIHYTQQIYNGISLIIRQLNYLHQGPLDPSKSILRSAHTYVKSIHPPTYVETRYV